MKSLYREIILARYVKRWRKNQDRRDAEITSGATKLINANGTGNCWFSLLSFMPRVQSTATNSRGGISKACKSAKAEDVSGSPK